MDQPAEEEIKAVHENVKENRLQEVEAFLQKYPEALHQLYEVPYGDRMSLLGYAVEVRALPVVLMLLEKGANPNQLIRIWNYGNNTTRMLPIIIWADERERTEMFEPLIRYGCRLDVRYGPNQQKTVEKELSPNSRETILQLVANRKRIVTVLLLATRDPLSPFYHFPKDLMKIILKDCRLL